MSFTDLHEELSNAINAAKVDILCSTADKGSIGANTLQDEASVRPNAASIAACNRRGNLLDQSQKEGFRCKFIGQNVGVGQVPFPNSDEYMRGSSASTAVAARMALLILACYRISNNPLRPWILI